MGDRGTDARHLVGCYGHSHARATHQQGPVGLTRSHLFGCVDGHVRIVDVLPG